MWILDLFKICFDYSRIFLGDKKSTLQRLENCYKIFMHIFWTTLTIRIDPEWTWFVLSEYRTAVLVNFNITRVRTPKASVLEQPKLINSAGDLLRFTECSLCSNKPLRHSKNREFSIHQFLFMRSIDRQGSALKICMPIRADKTSVQDSPNGSGRPYVKLLFPLRQVSGINFWNLF